MFIDPLSGMLVNLVAGLAILAGYAYFGVRSENQKAWAPAFAATGLVALATGLYLMFAWPLPGSSNIAFGEPYALYGALFLAAAWALAAGWNLLPVAIYGFFVAISAVVTGLRLWSMHAGKSPALEGLEFILTGLTGLATPLLGTPTLAKKLGWIVAALALISVVLWAATAYPSIWEHLLSFKKWVPVQMRAVATASK